MNAKSRMATHNYWAAYTLETLRKSRQEHFCCKDCLFREFSEVSDAFAEEFGSGLTLRGCSTNGYLHVECGLGGASFYANPRHGDEHEQVAMDLLFAAILLFHGYLKDQDVSELAQRPETIFTNDDQVAAWSGVKCAEAGC